MKLNEWTEFIQYMRQNVLIGASVALRRGCPPPNEIKDMISSHCHFVGVQKRRQCAHL
jgi:hypothetical protein